MGVDHSDYEYGRFLLVTEIEDELLHYAVEHVDGIMEFGSEKMDVWLEIRPDGFVRVVDEPLHGTQELQGCENGGPLWSAMPYGLTGGVARPMVFTFTTARHAA